MGRAFEVGYAILIVVFAIYGTLWGDYAFKGFWFNFGRAMIWPVIVLPGLGKLIGAARLLGFVGNMLTLRRR